MTRPRLTAEQCQELFKRCSRTTIVDPAKLIGKPLRRPKVNLQDLANETLVAKNRRLRQKSCRHEFVYSSAVTSRHGSSENSFCMDCGKCMNAGVGTASTT